MKKFRLSAGFFLTGTALVVGGLMAHAVTYASASTEACPEAQAEVSMVAHHAVTTTVSQGSLAIEPPPVVEPFTEQVCLDCHTDQERLTALAVEEEKVSLSEGPG